jgi:hypothetical protein
MNSFFDWLVILLLFFLFWGEPDVWDKAHAYVINNLESNQPKDCPKPTEGLIKHD